MLYALHVNVDVATLSFVIATVIPMLVALVTKQLASPRVKAVANLFFSAVAGVISTIIAETQGEIAMIEVSSFVVSIGIAWITSVATHYGLLKPAGITGTNGAIQRATASVGVGKDHRESPTGAGSH